MIKRMMIALVAAAMLVAMAIPAFADHKKDGKKDDGQTAIALCEDVTNTATATGGDANTGAQNTATVEQSNAVTAEGDSLVWADDITQVNAAEIDQFAWAEDTGDAQGGDAVAIAAACNAVNFSG